ncbi:oxidoreductase [Leucobacter sp. UCD-THU]|jgi:D-3-phosphoglycerate dehydrogenase|uniref:NAD(P)-dependent oxidoreductase n=1 Tax=Leucobacter sp. UCD-THU TaxID=1292023 RepID=UPI00037E8BE9|nr:NAD(P)-dependent oxidoreductase [Leucobacter sp. UCD-THU]EYT54618.1 oxidoreductase [Leucobacter sp. UCD-THU]
MTGPARGGADAVVVGLGPVDPALVRPFLPEGALFVADPSAGDLAVAEGAIVRAAFDVDRPLLDRMPRLRVVARTGVGVERVDVAAAAERGIAVAVTPGSNSRAVAEGAFAMVCSLVKRLGESNAFVASGNWGSGSAPVPGDLFGKTLAVLGFGRIGRIIAGFGAAFGMRVIVHDPFVRSEEYENASLEEAVRLADAITLHLPGGGGELLPIELLRTARPGLVLVNCARADLVSAATLRAGLDEGLLAGVGLDVFEVEPARDHPLAGDQRVLLSPHTTGLSEGAMAATFRMAAEAVTATLAGGSPAHVAAV